MVGPRYAATGMGFVYLLIFIVLGILLLNWLLTMPFRLRNIALRKRQLREGTLPVRLPPRRTRPGPAGGYLLPSLFLMEGGYFKLIWQFVWLLMVVYLIRWLMGSGKLSATLGVGDWILIAFGVAAVLVNTWYAVTRWAVFRGMSAEIEFEPMHPGTAAVMRIYGDPRRRPHTLVVQTKCEEVIRHVYFPQLGEFESTIYETEMLGASPVEGHGRLIYILPVFVPPDLPVSYEERDYKIRWSFMVGASSPLGKRLPSMEFYIFTVTHADPLAGLVR